MITMFGVVFGICVGIVIGLYHTARKEPLFSNNPWTGRLILVVGILLSFVVAETIVINVNVGATYDALTTTYNKCLDIENELAYLTSLII